MFAIRIYIALLTLVLSAAIVATREVGVMEFIVATFPLLYMILEMREELQGIESLRRRLSAAEAGE